MLYDDLEILRHIFDEATFIIQATGTKTKNDLLTDGLLSRAIIRSLEIIGEGSKKISEDLRTQHPHIEWRKMAGTRDRLIHNYFGVDYDIVWDVVINKIPELHHALSEILNETGV